MGTAYGISNCIGWYRANTGVYSNAGTTPAVTGNQVYQWNDLSGAGNHLIQATAVNRPVYNRYDAILSAAGADAMAQYNYATQSYSPTGVPSILFDGEDLFFNMPSGISLTSTGCTVLLCTRGPYFAPISFGTDGIDAINYGWTTSQQMAIWNNGVQPFPVSTFLPALSPMVHGFRCSGSLNQSRLYMGMNQTSDIAQNLCNMNMTGGAVGKTLNAGDPDFGDFPFLGEIYEIVIFSTALSDSDVRTVLVDMHSTNHIRLDANSNQGIFIGDSSIVGSPIAPPFAHCYPWVLYNQYGGTLKPLVMAGNSQSVALQQTAVTDFILGLDLSAFGANVAVICCGSDDIDAARTATQIASDLAVMCSGLRAAGFKVVITTLTPRDSVTLFDSTKINTLNTVNSLIRSGFTAYADALADWAADPRLSDCANETYYPDHRTTNEAGNGVKAEIVKAVLDPLLNPPTVSLAYASFYSPGRSFGGQFGNFLRS